MEENLENHSSLWLFLEKFNKIYVREEKKMPYHINLIDELNANENAHSRILQKLLCQQESINKKYEIFESFVNFIVEKYSQKEQFRKINIENPEITQEKERIDLWIRDNNYSIIFENKIHNAKEQNQSGGQLERYIDVTKGKKYSEEHIYVLYLPPTYEKEPTKESWGKYSDSEIIKHRYLNLSFKNDVLQWLKSSVLPNIRLKDKYLNSTIEQYIDHLEGKFSLRSINNNMNMELQKFIKNELGLNPDPEVALKTVINKKKDIDQVLIQLGKLEEEIRLDHFEKWEKKLRKDFPNPEIDIVGNWNNPNEYINIGVVININKKKSFSLLIEYSISSRMFYYGISKKHVTEIIDDLTLEKIIENSDSELKFREDHCDWYGWEYIVFDNAYERLKFLIEKINCQDLT